MMKGMNVLTFRFAEKMSDFIADGTKIFGMLVNWRKLKLPKSSVPLLNQRAQGV